MKFRDVYDNKKRKKKCKPCFKRWDFNKLLKQIRFYLIAIKDNKFNSHNYVSHPCFIAEGLSEQFRAKMKLVHKAIHILKREGIEDKYIIESNGAPHDSSRNKFFWHGPNKSGWAATVYYLVDKKNDLQES